MDPKLYEIYHFTGGKHSDDSLYPDVNLESKGAAKQIDKHIREIKRFNVHLDVILERRGSAYFITNSELKF